MLNKVDFNYIVTLSKKQFFLKHKKKLKFIKKLSIYFSYKRYYVDIYDKMKEYWFIFMRFESLFGFLPKINSLKTRRKGKTKKIIFLRSTAVIKSFSTNAKKIENILDYVLNLHNYLYLKFLLNKKHKVVRFEELVKHFIRKTVLFQHNSFLFENNLYFKWLDLSRNFTNIKEIFYYIYKRKFKFFSASRKLKFYDCKFVIVSDYYKFLTLPFKVLIKNYKKLLVYLFKKLRRRKKKKNEKAYILL